MLVGIHTHHFEKQNLITLQRGKKNYDKVKCKHCGLEGIRYGLDDVVNVRRDKQCVVKQRQKVRIISDYPCQQFGFVKNEIYDRAECPEHQKAKHAKDVWVYSEKRKEPVRLLADEYILVE